MERASRSWPPLAIQRARLWRKHLLPFLTPVHLLNVLTGLLPEQRGWRDAARPPHRHHTPDVRILDAFRARLGVLGLRQGHEAMLDPLMQTATPGTNATALVGTTDLPAACGGFKKKTQKEDTVAYAAHRAALGGRVLKTGGSRWLVGCRMHSSRFYLPSPAIGIDSGP